MSIDFTQLREFLMAIAQTEITDLTLKSEDFELVVRQGRTVSPAENGAAADIGSGVRVPPPPIVSADASAEPSPKEKKWLAVTSPMVGTFYRSPAPGEKPFVEVNDSIRTTQTVCIIEAMKLMNEIESEISGRVVEISVENGEPVEYGQTLMWVDPE